MSSFKGNNDLARFSGWAQNDPRYQALLTVSRNATLRAGKFWGNAGQQYLSGNPLSPDVRFVQNGPSMDGWTPPARGRGNSRGADDWGTRRSRPWPGRPVACSRDRERAAFTKQLALPGAGRIVHGAGGEAGAAPTALR